jgi:hypothetical protein
LSSGAARRGTRLAAGVTVGATSAVIVAAICYDVIDGRGLEWSAKIGAEAQPDVVVSRILWGLGYRQPPVYYLRAWRLSGGRGDDSRQAGARFRPKLDSLRRDNEYWSTRELKGLLVVLLMLNSTDLKDDNNSLYRPSPRWDGELFPRRNWVDGFERRGFITRIDGDRVAFDYDGRHQALLHMITPADVRWAGQRTARLTVRQWRDAFRSAHYDDVIAGRYIARIRQKIDDGLALRVRPAGGRPS